MPAAIKILFAVDLALAAMHLWNPAMPDWAARGESVDYLWDLDREANLPTWFASMQLTLIGVLLLAFAHLRESPPRRETWGLSLAGAGFLLLSLDEQVLLHEKLGRGIEQLLGHRDTTAFDVTGPWALFLAPVFIAVAIAIAYVLRGLFAGRRRQALLIAGGLALFVGSAAGIELLTNFVSITRERYTALFEETGELVGSTLILWGVYELVRDSGPWPYANPRPSGPLTPEQLIRRSSGSSVAL